MKTHPDYFVLLVGALLGVCLVMGSAAAQVWEEWVETYNAPANQADFASAVCVDENSNVFVTGMGTTANLVQDVVTIKYDATGTQQWLAVYNGGSDERGVGISLDSQGNVIVLGDRWIGGDDYVIIKYNGAGIQQWVATGYASGYTFYPWAMALDAEDNVYVTGGESGAFPTVKYNSHGVFQWMANYPSQQGLTGGEAITIDGEQNVIVTGLVFDFNTSYDYMTIKYNPLGQQLWASRYTGPDEQDDAHAILADPSGNIYVTGESDGEAPGGNEDIATIKYDPNGQEQWVSRWTSPGHLTAGSHSIGRDARGNLYVSGNAYALGTPDDRVTIKYDSNGVIQWTQTYTVPPGSGSVAQVVTQRGDAYVAGSSGGDFLTMKYDYLGVLQWTATYDPPYNGSNAAADIAIDQDENVYVVGQIASSTVSPDYVTIKYNQNTTYVTILLDPIGVPIQIPPAGGSFNFNISLTNNDSSAQTFDAWIMLQLPGGSWYGPVLGPVGLTLPGQGSLTRLRSQNVPGRAPAGTYTYRGYAGDYPAKRDSSSFTFEKLGVGGLGLEGDDWTNAGEEFDLAEVGARHASPLQPEGLTASVSPNPFNLTTVLSYQSPVASNVSLEIYDLSGRPVATLVNGWRAAGDNQVTWDASNLPSGIYVYRIEAGNWRAAGKMILLK